MINVRADENELEAILGDIDEDRSGEIDFDEFFEYMQRRVQDEDKDELLQSFQNIVTPEERAHGAITQERLEALLREYIEIRDEDQFLLPSGKEENVLTAEEMPRLIEDLDIT